MRRRVATAVLAGTILVSGLGITEPAQAETAPTVVDHGEVPITAVSVLAADSGTMPDGSARTWAVVVGKPATLVELDPVAGTRLRTFPLGNADGLGDTEQGPSGSGSSGAWGVELAADGTVWVAGHLDAALYYLAPGATQLVKTQRPLPNSNFLWQVDTDDAGVAYTGTFQGRGPTPLEDAHVVSFDRSSARGATTAPSVSASAMCAAPR